MLFQQQGLPVLPEKPSGGLCPVDESSWAAVSPADGRLWPLAHLSQTMPDSPGTSGGPGSWGLNTRLMDGRKECGRASRSAPQAVVAAEEWVGGLALWLRFSPSIQVGGDRNRAIEMRFLLTSPAADSALAHTSCVQ